jgi:hypothetical protein
MKKTIVLVLCLLVMCIGISFAGNLESVVVDVSTQVTTGNNYNQHGLFALAISSTARKTLISHVTLTSDDSTDAQTVTLWDGWSAGNSTASVSKIWEWDLDAYSSSETVVIQEYFLDGDRAYLKADYGLGVTKTSTGSGITLSIQYK